MNDPQAIVLFVCGDVMTGRGIDQILPHPSQPRLYEPFVTSALEYVALAERRSGRISRPVDPAYIWGDALAILERRAPQLRIVNLETAVTACDQYWPGKGIHYRMHPGNLAALEALRPDCCVLANNHTLDWGEGGLVETLDVLHEAGMATAGAGRNRAEARAPAVMRFDAGGRSPGRVLVFACALESSGAQEAGAATETRPGIAWLPDLSIAHADSLLESVAEHKCSGDVAVVSIHWGPNWGYAIGPQQRAFAHRLVEGGVDVVHGHSSHHVKGIEVHRERLILYGCGDFLDDYEGIEGYEHYRADLGLMYFPRLDARSGRLLGLNLVPTRIGQLRVNRASADEARWLQAVLNREGRSLGSRAERDEGDALGLRWE